MAITRNNKGKASSPKRQGEYGKRILITKKMNGREVQYHATKGWRSYRIAQVAS
ncbi:MAG: hypothetical protein II336_17955 [Loktanella sp.]|nr:hypothetical protein [Loktanella sp.]